jgi:hypothetical protein
MKLFTSGKKALRKIHAIGSDSIHDAGLTDQECNPDSQSSKPSRKERKQFLRNKGEAPYELKNI